MLVNNLSTSFANCKEGGVAAQIPKLGLLGESSMHKASTNVVKLPYNPTKNYTIFYLY